MCRNSIHIYILPKATCAQVWCFNMHGGHIQLNGSSWKSGKFVPNATRMHIQINASVFPSKLAIVESYISVPCKPRLETYRMSIGDSHSLYKASYVAGWGLLWSYIISNRYHNIPYHGFMQLNLQPCNFGNLQSSKSLHDLPDVLPTGCHGHDSQIDGKCAVANKPCIHFPQWKSNIGLPWLFYI